jgi:fatty acid desaturase
MLFAAIGFAGAGVAWAVARAREMNEGESDFGMRTVTTLLLLFGAACTVVAAGFIGVLAYGGVIAWFSYVCAAHRLGIFRIQQVHSHTEMPVERRRIA